MWEIDILFLFSLKIFVLVKILCSGKILRKFIGNKDLVEVRKCDF